MLRILKNRQLRRVIIATFFALAFIWVAVRWFNVDWNIMYVFAVLAFLLVGVLILLGFVFSFLLHLFTRRGSGMLGKIEQPEDVAQKQREPGADQEEKSG